MDFGSIFLFLHIGGAIAAFGPTIAFPLIAAKASAEPQHGNFALRITQFLTARVVEPGAVFVFLMGLGLILTRDWNPFTTLWLGLAIIIFLITLGFSVFFQRPTINKMVEMTIHATAPAGGGLSASWPAAGVRGCLAACGPGRHVHDGHARHHPVPDGVQADLRG